MKCFYTNSPLTVFTDLKYIVRYTLQSWENFRGAHWAPLGGLGGGTAKLEPGTCRYLLGGRESLIAALANVRYAKIGTTCGSGLGIAVQTKCTLGVGDRLGGLLKSALPVIGASKKSDDTRQENWKANKVGGNERARQYYAEKTGFASVNSEAIAKSQAAYNDLIRRTLTIVSVYNTSTGGRGAPVGDGGERIHASTLTYCDIGVWLNTLLVGNLMRKGLGQKADIRDRVDLSGIEG